jgi:hypothetical protein
LPETTWARVSKDSETEKGGKICASGKITQISVNRSDGWVRSDVIMRSQREYFTILAVGSSGDLIDGSVARVCGIATGTWYFANVNGSLTPSVYLVGAFDLPENREQYP